ncbi:MAG: hypothetical protein ACU0CO_17465 [Shimia sp.]
MSKDPVQQLVDEITLIRGEVQALKRTSLDREDAEILNAEVREALDRMGAAAESAPQALRAALEADRAETARLAIQSATEAAQEAVEGVRGQLEVERQEYAQRLSDARREARRARLLSWPIVTTLLATGALLGVSVAYGTETAKSAFDVETMVRWGCGTAAIGGTTVEQDSGARFCAFWIVTPEQAASRRAREESTGG